MEDHMTDRPGVVRTPKPWGYEDLWAITRRYAGKVLHVTRGHQLSLQYHERKEETILLYAGRLILLLEDEAGTLCEHWLEPGEARHIPAGRLHRMIAVEDCDVLEVSTPELDDVVRVDDAYGRAAVPAESRS
ncbi:MAG TPA: cupin [Candidatus Limnocylindria bacterium]|nr:cupin [Candidatus Limnocylindria bacterium]